MRASPLLLAVLAGCGPDTQWEAPWAETAPPCRVTFCLPGAGGPEAGDNPTLDLWCKDLPGIVQRCDDGTCRALMHDVGEARAAWSVVSSAIERELSAEAQAACEVRVVGYSWGGVDAVAFAGELAKKQDAPNKVSLVVVLDGFTPFGERFIDVPDGLGEVVSFRHSISDPDDCSADDPFGPYRGLPLRCSRDAACHDFDLSKNGAAHDHCDMVEDPGELWWWLLFGFPIESVDRTFEVPVLRR